MFAQEDWAAEDYVGTPTFSGSANIYPDNYRPLGGNNMAFVFPYDLNATDPKTYINASVTQLFYTANKVCIVMSSDGGTHLLTVV